MALEQLAQLSFSVAENKGVFALLLGSGLSRAAGIPTGWEITLDLIRRFASLQGVPDQDDWVKWYREQSGEEPNYSKIVEFLGGSPSERRSILHPYIEPSGGDRDRGLKLPTPAHHAIAELVASGHLRVIVTTNFDRLIENALREHGVEPTVVSSVDMMAGAEPITHSKCYVLKIHGDYKDARLLNTDSELAAYPREFDALLDRIFDEHGLIVCGWSGDWDIALRRAMLRAPNRRYPVYWTTRASLRDEAQQIATHRGARVITITDADTFFGRLRESVRTLDQTRSVNPRSTELTVATVKRYVSRQEYRVELDDLIAEEADRMVGKLGDESFGTGGRWSQEEFRLRILRYEAIAETTAQVAGVLGRWGGEREFNEMYELVRALYDHAQNNSNGLIAWVNLRSYPAVVTAAAYGLGLLREQRFSSLHTFLSCPISRKDREPFPIAAVLSTIAWNGASNELWHHFPELERHHTAFSDYLLALFGRWGKSFIGLAGDFELLFDRFELLQALTFFERYELAELQKIKLERPGQAFAFVPVGRFAWRTSHLRALTDELRNGPTRESLLNAGFAKGSAGMLDLFIEAIGYASRRMY